MIWVVILACTVVRPGDARNLTFEYEGLRFQRCPLFRGRLLERVTATGID